MKIIRQNPITLRPVKIKLKRVLKGVRKSNKKTTR